jgi:NAD(P)-dependent dehydrogenase (short-subunit alcohol dehydrogenase family)
VIAQARRVWLLIECSGGIGRALAESVLSGSGDCVVAAVHGTASVCDLYDLAPDRFMSVPVEMTDCSSITAAITAAQARFGPVDVIVSCARADSAGLVEQAPEYEIRGVFDVNFFGVLHAAQAAMPYLRARRQGHFAAVTSAGAFLGRPGSGVESASTAAALALLESLAGEARPLGVCVTAIACAPGRGEAGEYKSIAGSIVEHLAVPESPTHLVLGRNCMDGVLNKLDVLGQLMLGTHRTSENLARESSLVDWSALPPQQSWAAGAMPSHWRWSR